MKGDTGDIYGESGQIKQDSMGRMVLFPWGPLGDGYVLGEGEDVAALDRRLLWSRRLTIVAVVVSCLAPFWWVPILVAALAFSIDWIWLRSRTTEGARSETRLSLDEVLRHRARTTSTAFLILAAMVFVLFVVAGLAGVLAVPDRGPTASLGIAFGGLGLVYVVRIWRARSRIGSAPVGRGAISR